jgi:hypothetical protein
VVTIAFSDGREASIHRGEWTSSDALLQRMCETAAWVPAAESGYVPDWDLRHAEQVISTLGDGQITHVDPPEDVPGRVY